MHGREEKACGATGQAGKHSSARRALRCLAHGLLHTRHTGICEERRFREFTLLLCALSIYIFYIYFPSITLKLGKRKTHHHPPSPANVELEVLSDTAIQHALQMALTQQLSKALDMKTPDLKTKERVLKGSHPTN